MDQRWSTRSGADTAVPRATPASRLRLRRRTARPSLPVEAIDPLVIHPESLPSQQHPQPPVAEAPALRRQGIESFPDLRVVGPDGSVADYRSVHANQPAGAALAEAPPLLDTAGGLAPSRRR